MEIEMKFVLILSIYSSFGCHGYGQNVCYDARSSRYCCSDHEDINGTCTPCRQGFFTSDVGSPCTKCTDSYYGDRCLKECHCSENQICDHVIGCIDRPSTYPDITDQSTDLLEKTTFYTSQTSNSTAQTNSIGELHFDWRIYSGTITGIVVIIWICFAYKKIRKRNTNRSIKDVNVTESSVAMGNDIADASNEIYHLIDESKMVDVDLEAIHDSESLTNSNYQGGNRTSYLTPVPDVLYSYPSLFEGIDKGNPNPSLCEGIDKGNPNPSLCEGIDKGNPNVSLFEGIDKGNPHSSLCGGIDKEYANPSLCEGIDNGNPTVSSHYKADDSNPSSCEAIDIENPTVSSNYKTDDYLVPVTKHGGEDHKRLTKRTIVDLCTDKLGPFSIADATHLSVSTSSMESTMSNDSQRSVYNGTDYTNPYQPLQKSTTDGGTIEYSVAFSRCK